MAKFNLDNYETVEDRLKKYWADNPNGKIVTNVVHITDDGTCITIKAEVYRDKKDAMDEIVATGIAQETKGQGGFANTDAWVENCETSAIGRALANWMYQGSKAPRPSREEMSKTTGGETPESPKKKEVAQKTGTSPSEPVKQLKNSVNLKNLIFIMCNENKEFAKKTYEYALSRMIIKKFPEDVEAYDEKQMSKFLDMAEEFCEKHKAEGENMKPFEDMDSVEKVQSVFTDAVEIQGDGMVDIPSGKWEGEPCSDAQKKFIQTLATECTDSGSAEAKQLANEAMKMLVEGTMTKKNASEWIDKLKEAKS